VINRFTHEIPDTPRSAAPALIHVRSEAMLTPKSRATFATESGEVRTIRTASALNSGV
jgi:hypothetical protein